MENFAPAENEGAESRESALQELERFLYEVLPLREGLESSGLPMGGIVERVGSLYRRLRSGGEPSPEDEPIFSEMRAFPKVTYGVLASLLRSQTRPPDEEEGLGELDPERLRFMQEKRLGRLRSLNPPERFHFPRFRQMGDLEDSAQLNPPLKFRFPVFRELRNLASSGRRSSRRR